jgi:hypothetical protein
MKSNPMQTKRIDIRCAVTSSLAAPIVYFGPVIGMALVGYSLGIGAPAWLRDLPRWVAVIVWLCAVIWVAQMLYSRHRRCYG